MASGLLGAQRGEHALLQFLAEEIEQVVAPLAGRDGSTYYVDGDRVISIFPKRRQLPCVDSAR